MEIISLFITNLSPGGAERVAVNIANELCQRGYEVHVVLIETKGGLIKQLLPQVQVVDLKCRRIIQALPKLISYLKKTSPNALIAFMWPLTLMSIWAKWFSGQTTKVLVTEHCTWSGMPLKKNFFLNIMKWSMRTFYPYAHTVITVSHGAKKDLVDFASLAENQINLKAVYNPVIKSNPTFSGSFELPITWRIGSHQKILAVGNLKDVKDFKTLIKAFKIVTFFKEVKLLILGEGEERNNLSLLIKDLNLEQSCFLYGQSNHPEAFYQVADLFVLSSLSEGLPTVLIEALSHGLTVVSTDCPNGPAEILMNGQYGRSVPVGDIEKLAINMINALNFPDDKKHLKKRAEFFSIAKSVDEYIQVLEETR